MQGQDSRTSALVDRVFPEPKREAKVPTRTDDEWAAMVRRDLAKTVSGIVAAGRHLAEWKADTTHGDFLALVEETTTLTPRTVQMLMRIGRHPVIRKAQHASLLPPHWTTLYELSRMDEQQLGQAIGDDRITPELQRKDAKAIVRQYRDEIDDAATQPSEPTEINGSDPTVGIQLDKILKRFRRHIRDAIDQLSGDDRTAAITMLREELASLEGNGS
jgi:hypothetical protein